jgi:hypothetical protein
MSTTSHIVSLLIEERSRFEAAIAALQGSPKPVNNELPALPKVKAAAAPKRKGLSAATRRRMAEGQKRRYAAIRAAKAAAAAPAPVAATPKATAAKAPVRVKKGGLTEAGRKALSIAMKKRWAAKKKAAAKKAA